MTQRILRPAALGCAIAVFVCAAILSFDYVRSRRRASADESRVAALQNQVRQDADRAAALYAEQQRITRDRDARRARIRYLKWVLLAFFALFVAGAKGLAGTRPRPAVVASPPLPASAPCPPPPPRPVAPAASWPVDLAFVDELVAREGTGSEAAIAILQAIQNHYRYLPVEALQRVCEMTAITPAQIAGASSFYGSFRRVPAGRHTVRICHGTACHVAGARQISEQLRRDLAIPDGSDTDLHRDFTLEEVACLGCCSLAPVLMVDDCTAGKLTPATVHTALDAVRSRERA